MLRGAKAWTGGSLPRVTSVYLMKEASYQTFCYVNIFQGMRLQPESMFRVKGSGWATVFKIELFRLSGSSSCSDCWGLRFGVQNFPGFNLLNGQFLRVGRVSGTPGI